MSDQPEKLPSHVVEACDRVLRAWARENPEHAAWIAAGAPPINTQEDHVRWFGHEYVAPTRRRK